MNQPYLPNQLPEHLAELDRQEQQMGDPFESENALSFSTAITCDDAAVYPEQAMGFLRDEGYYQFHVPKRYGGQLVSYQNQYHLIRSIARRDVTAATAYVLHSIGYWPILIAGTDEQIAKYSAHILKGEGVSWSVTEREHGSDLVNNQSIATKTENGYTLSGSKWPIGMCQYNRFTMFLARTGEEIQPDAFSLFCVDSYQHEGPEFKLLPLEKLYGVRGLPLSGVTLTNYPVDEKQLIGGEGRGLELMLRNQQLPRVGASALATGGFDTALRITMSFAEQRQLFGSRLSDLAVTKGQLADVFCDLLLCESTMNFATRSLHFYPKMMFLWGAVAKYLVPHTLDSAMGQLTDILGARYYLRESFAGGMFQKTLRDIGLAGFADGNKKVNLKNISMHMEMILPYLENPKPLSEQERTHFAQYFDIFTPVPDEDYRKLQVFSGRKDYIFLFLEDSIEKLDERFAQSAITDTIAQDIKTTARQIKAALAALPKELKELKLQLGSDFGYSPESYRISQKYAALHAAAGLIHTVVYSELQAPLNKLEWVAPCLRRVFRWSDSTLPFPSAEDNQAVVNILRTMLNQQMAFTLIPLKLAETDNSFNCPAQMNT